MMEELMNPEFVKKLVAETHLSLDGSTGQKNNVSAYFVVFQGAHNCHAHSGFIINNQYTQRFHDF